MAPEILESCSYSKKSDVYAFGMTVYELFALQKPFEGHGMVKVMSDVVQGERPIIPPSVDNSIRNLIKRCWDSNPEKRPTFSEILEFLQNSNKIQRKLENKQEFLNYIDYIDNKAKLEEPAKIILYPNSKDEEEDERKK